MTGATGFLGRRLVAELVEQTDLQLCLLARDPAAATKRFAHLPRNRIEIVPGDVARPALGLSRRHVERLARRVTEIWHLGASTSFRESDRAELMRVNVSGTQNALALAKNCPRLDRFFQMSTAFVAGRRIDPIPEGTFDASAGFKNPYEESKYAAELLVRDAPFPWVILRPSIVMGDSDTGQCDGETRMMYGFVLGVCRAVMHAFESSDQFWESWRRRNGDTAAYPRIDAGLVALGTATTNLITRDDASRICLAARSASATDATYNITNPQSLTNQQIIEQIQSVLKIRGIWLDPQHFRRPRKALSMVERVAMRNTKIFWPYIRRHSPIWVTDQVDRLGVPRIEMTEPLFRHLIHTYFQRMVPR